MSGDGQKGCTQRKIIAGLVLRQGNRFTHLPSSKHLFIWHYQGCSRQRERATFALSVLAWPDPLDINCLQIHLPSWASLPNIAVPRSMKVVVLGHPLGHPLSSLIWGWYYSDCKLPSYHFLCVSFLDNNEILLKVCVLWCISVVLASDIIVVWVEIHKRHPNKYLCPTVMQTNWIDHTKIFWNCKCEKTWMNKMHFFLA